MTEDKGYYQDNKDLLLNSFKGFMENHCLPVLRRYVEQDIDELFPEMINELEEIIPEIPYIGGDSNFFTRFMVGSAMILAIYKTLRNHEIDLTDEQFGEIVFLSYDSHFDEELNWFTKKMYKLLTTSFVGRWYMRRMEKTFEEQPYEYKFEFDYHSSDDDNLIYGMEFNTCGIKKWLTDQGYPQLTPYICMLDHIFYHKIGVNLKRSRTIGMRGKSCNFQFVKSMPDKPQGLPLDQYDDYKNWIELTTLD